MQGFKSLFQAKKKAAMARLLDSFSFDETNQTIMCKFFLIDRVCKASRVYFTQKKAAMARLLDSFSFNETNQTVMCEFF